ncbi:uncharacterized protein LOC144646855 isoform X2 [Oculina patagonica]
MSPSTAADWFTAQTNCSKYNAHLVTVSSQSENSFLIQKIISKRRWKSRHFWIGLQRAPFDISFWLWVDGSQLSFSGWYSGQPDNYRQEEYCGEMYVLQVNSGVVGWNDLNCSHASSFICEKELIGLPSCSKDNGGCQHLCLWTFDNRRICKCKDGYISQKDGAVCLDPKMIMPQEAQAQPNTSFDVALLIIQLLSLALLIPMCCVLVSFYRRVSQQRRRNNMPQSGTVMINAPLSNEEHSLDSQTSPVTSTTFDDEGNGEDTCRA